MDLSSRSTLHASPAGGALLLLHGATHSPHASLEMAADPSPGGTPLRPEERARVLEVLEAMEDEAGRAGGGEGAGRHGAVSSMAAMAKTPQRGGWLDARGAAISPVVALGGAGHAGGARAEDPPASGMPGLDGGERHTPASPTTSLTGRGARASGLSPMAERDRLLLSLLRGGAGASVARRGAPPAKRNLAGAFAAAAEGVRGGDAA